MSKPQVGKTSKANYFNDNSHCLAYGKGNYTACIWVLRFLGFLCGWEGETKEQSNAFRFCQEKKNELSKSKTNLALDTMWGNLLVSFHLSRCRVQTQSTDSHTENKRSGHRKLIKSISRRESRWLHRQAGFFSFLIPSSFQKWHLQKLPKHSR